jgi:uncharacterized protein
MRQKRLRLIRQIRKTNSSEDIIFSKTQDLNELSEPRYNRFFNWVKVFGSSQPVSKFEGGRAWSGWATLGFGLIIGVLYISVIVVTIMGFVLVSFKVHTASNFQTFLVSIINRQNTSILAAGAITTAIVCTPLLWLIMKVRSGISIVDYLGIKKVKITTITAWLVLTFIMVVLLHTVLHILNHSKYPNIDLIYNKIPLIFWIATIIFAPILEEVFFRGFLFKGFWQSRIGIIPTILLMSIAWAILHYEYGLLSLVALFIFGIFLGIARYRTNSIWTPLLMHAIWNTIALLSTFVFK